ncbi:hypothetical protein Tco_1271147 [Tanacetum coccineum]
MLSETPKLLSGIEDSHHGPSDAMYNPPQLLKSDTKVFTMTMEIIPEPTSNKLCGRTASAAVKPCQGDSLEFYLMTGSNLDGGSSWSKTSQIYSHMLILDQHKTSRKMTIQAFKMKKTYEHVGPKVTSTQEGKILQDDDMRLYSADDLKKLKDHMQVKLEGTSTSLKSKDHYTYHKMKDKESRPRAKTEDIHRMLSLRFL